MRIVFVRHGEPDYQNDTLTEKGWREAELLSKRIINWNVEQFYCSPLGRAKDTASCTLNKLNREAVILPWMREFSYPIDDPVTGRHGVPWDFVPSYWTSQPLMYDIDRWVETDVMRQNPDIAPSYKEVCNNFDSLLSAYGYVREGDFYRITGKEERFMTGTGSLTADDEENRRTQPLIVIFCHLGVTCLVLSHLLNIPFPLLVHGFFLPTTSLTVLTSEERWGTEAYFRVQTIGDVNHLLTGGEPISAAGSFANVFQG
ncbi:MAG: histidine phosphatase family protein [Lachnospiraceae bacterium]|nr:histidine phosphatase family protein [Lachnospiraceae bacterium]